MTTAYWIAIFCIGLIWIPWLFRAVIRPAREKHQSRQWLQEHNHLQQVVIAEQIIAQLYADQSTHASANLQRKILRLEDNDQFLYGEVELISLAELLYKLELKQNEVFYDLGCGGGKAVYTAALLYPFRKVCGIELLPGLYQLAEDLRQEFNILTAQLPSAQGICHNVQFENQNILACDISDASVIFINATGFYGEFWLQIIDKLLTLKPYTKIILTSLTLPESKFELLLDVNKAMSWGNCSVRVYQKRPDISGSTPPLPLN